MALAQPFGALLAQLVESVANRKPCAGIEPLESTWALECESAIVRIPAAERMVVLSYGALGPLRREFLKRLNSVHKDLSSADATYGDLRQMAIPDAPPLDTLRVREFVRTLFLSGNGALLFGNSFVEWGASEALRRAQPQAMFCSFGIRAKLKPFSSVVLFEDQNRANPTPDQPDPAGSLADVRPLAEYIYLSARRLPGRTATLFAAAEQDRLLILAPPEFLPESGPLSSQSLCANTLRWLS